MSDISQFTLVRALELSIKRISDRFNDDWLFAGHCFKESGISCMETKSSRYNESYPSDYHSFIEICVCVSGSFAISIPDDIYEIKEGGACIIFPGLMHSKLYTKGTEHLAIWMAFDPNTIRIHLSGNKQNELFTTDVRTLAPDHEYNNIINNINMEKKDENTFSSMLFKIYILHILIITLKRIIIDTASPESNMFKKKIAEEIKDFIENNGFRYLHLRDISQGLFISAGYLNNIFKSVTGSTIMQYVENCRIEKAMYLLKHTNESISSISTQLGYYDQYHFSKSFKKVTGNSPTKYRMTMEE